MINDSLFEPLYSAELSSFFNSNNTAMGPLLNSVLHTCAARQIRVRRELQKKISHSLCLPREIRRMFQRGGLRVCNKLW